MKSVKWFLALSIVIVSMHQACGHRIREASSGKSAAEVSELFRGLQSSSSGTSTSLQQATKMLEDYPETVVYFSEAPGEMGPLHAVLPLDFSFVSDRITSANLESARAYFLDLLTEEGHKNYLIIEYKIVGDASSGYAVYSNEGMDYGSIVDGEFTSVLKNETGEMIVVRSYDIDDNEDLTQTIQLEFSGINASGQEEGNLGQISSMEGFSIYF